MSKGSKYDLEKLGDYGLSDNMEYALYLYISYCSKFGIDPYNVVEFVIDNSLDNSNYLFNADKDFKNWVLKNILAQDQYAEYLKKKGINLDSEDVIELYCGKLDAIKRDKEVISPYASTIGQDNSILYNSDDTLFKISKKSIKKLKNGKTYIIKNPYSVTNLLYLLQTLGGTDNKIILSFFGKSGDIDKLKIKPMVKEISSILAKNIDDDIILDYKSNNDFYLYNYVMKTRNIKKTTGYLDLMSKKELEIIAKKLYTSEKKENPAKEKINTTKKQKTLGRQL